MASSFKEDLQKYHFSTILLLQYVFLLTIFKNISFLEQKKTNYPSSNDQQFVQHMRVINRLLCVV